MFKCYTKRIYVFYLFNLCLISYTHTTSDCQCHIDDILNGRFYYFDNSKVTFNGQRAPRTVRSILKQLWLVVITRVIWKYSNQSGSPSWSLFMGEGNPLIELCSEFTALIWRFGIQPREMEAVLSCSRKCFVYFHW